MDNRTINVISEGNKGLGLALQLIWDNAAGGKVSHYKVMRLTKTVTYYKDDKGEPNSHYTRLEESSDGHLTLILLWHEERDSTPLPYPLNLQQAIEFVSGWLAQADYGTEPDHDGSNSKGWRVFTEAWGHVAGHHFSICAVQPRWAMHGK